MHKCSRRDLGSSLMAKIHLDTDEHSKFICCLNVKCLSKYIPRNWMDSCSFASPTICMG